MLVAITGGLGCGKSTVLDMFRALGAVVISADEIVSKLLDTDVVREALVGLLGRKVLLPDGSIDRKMVADAIFSSDYLRIKVEQIIHPLVYMEIERLAERYSGEIVVAEVPLLFESEMQDMFHSVITVIADEKSAMERLAERGMSMDEADRRIRCQMDVNMKAEKVDFVIDNSGALSNTRAQVSKIWQELVNINERKGK